VQKRSPRMLTTGFLLGIISFFMVILAWVLPRVPGWLF